MEKNKVAESMREELMECRMELETLKAAPATEESKGKKMTSFKIVVTIDKRIFVLLIRSVFSSVTLASRYKLSRG